eukprot:scaffold24345_cov64-Attheya_sp.AAC.1
MGCSQSKKSSANAVLDGAANPVLHDLLQSAPGKDPWSRIVEICRSDPKAASYCDPSTNATPLHEACRRVDRKVEGGKGSATEAVRALIQAFPEAVSHTDSQGCIPLHYAMSPSLSALREKPKWLERKKVIEVLIPADYDVSIEYLSRNDIAYDGGGMTALYNAIECLTDDFTMPGPSLEFVRVIHEANPDMVTVRNASDGDRPLALLYRRFTRQFDLSEKFFPGDNSRPEVVAHRKAFKIAAGNTWNNILLLLRPTPDQAEEGDAAQQQPKTWRILHKAAQIEIPPDLLRYMVETNMDGVQTPDEDGSLPLHYAAKAVPPYDGIKKASSFPAFYSKYVIDELLYKYSQGAAVPDAEGNLALALAVRSGKKWIGGGVKSLYHANPAALEQVDMDKYPSLSQAMSFVSDNGDSYDDDDDEDAPNGIQEDQQHDAIMLVQRADADLGDITSAMWANEEDAGVMMLGCLAIAKKAEAARTKKDNGQVLQIALSAVAAVVNAMKSHPNEPIVQEKACSALASLAYADGKREVSFVASSAISAVVGAMQAHVADPVVQEQGCRAVANIVSQGGSERATIVASVSGVTAIVNSLGAHPKVGSVQREACRALEVLTDYQDANLPDLPRGQTGPLLEAAKRRFPDECTKSADVILTRLS